MGEVVIEEKSYIRRILLSIDQGLNVWFSPVWNWMYDTDKFGNEDETISSVLGKLQPEGKAARFRGAVNWVFLHLTGEQSHCAENIEADEGR